MATTLIETTRFRSGSTRAHPKTPGLLYGALARSTASRARLLVTPKSTLQKVTMERSAIQRQATNREFTGMQTMQPNATQREIEMQVCTLQRERQNPVTLKLVAYNLGLLLS